MRSSLTIPSPHCAARATTFPTQINDRSVHFFLDFSNIAISAQQVANDFGDSVFDSYRVRIDSGNLRDLVLRGREWRSGYAAAGLNDLHAPFVNRFRELGFKFDVCERGCKSGREQGIDDKIQKELFRLACSRQPRGTVVLATGDGNGHELDEGFIPALQAVHEAGFAVEVMSWGRSFNCHLRSWAKNNGKAIVLDAFYPEITFVEGGRRVRPLGNIFKKLAKQCIS